MSTNYDEKVKRIRSSGLTCFMPLNEERGTAVLDYSDNGYNGTSSGLGRGVGYREFVGPDGDKCAYFDGSAGYVDISAAAASSASSSQTEGSMSVWVAVPEANLSATTKMNIVYCAADTANGISLNFDTTAYRFAAGYNAGSGNATYSVTQNTVLTYNVDGAEQRPEWHHLGMTYSATNDALILYVDGTASTTASTLGTWTGNYATTALCLGSSSTTWANGFTGWMADFAWWSNTILTASEMEELADIGP